MDITPLRLFFPPPSLLRSIQNSVAQLRPKHNTTQSQTFISLATVTSGNTQVRSWSSGMRFFSLPIQYAINEQRFAICPLQVTMWRYIHFQILMNLISLLFWDVMQRMLVVIYRRLVTTYPSHLKGSSGRSSWTAWLLKMGRIGSPEMSANNYRSTLRNTPEEHRSHLHHGRNLNLVNFIHIMLLRSTNWY